MNNPDLNQRNVMITLQQYENSLKIVKTYLEQKQKGINIIEYLNDINPTYIKLNEHFKPLAASIIKKCYYQKYGVSSNEITVNELSQLNDLNLIRYRGFGVKSQSVLNKLIENKDSVENFNFLIERTTAPVKKKFMPVIQTANLTPYEFIYFDKIEYLMKNKKFLIHDYSILHLAYEIDSTIKEATRLIRKIYGVSFRCLINYNRICYFDQLIREEIRNSRKYNIYELCSLSGFNSRSLFYLYFKKFYDLKPSELY